MVERQIDGQAYYNKTTICIRQLHISKLETNSGPSNLNVHD